MNLFRLSMRINKHESSRSFFCVQCQGFFENFPIFFVHFNNRIIQLGFIIKFYFIAGCLMKATNESGHFWNINSPFGQFCSNFWMISNHGDASGIDRSRTATACAAIITSIMGIIHRACTVTDCIDNWSKVFNKPNASE